MKEFKPLPIGVEDFKVIIDKGSYYVDKTDMIRELLDSGATVNLFTRPRRFGKTLNLSMLQRFFEKTDEDNAYLFDGLNISQAGEKYMHHQGQYPVISLSLKSMKQPNYDLSFYTFRYMIRSEFGRHIEALQSDQLLPEDKKYSKKSAIIRQTTVSLSMQFVFFRIACMQSIRRKSSS
ncbi:MAG: AAA family ATPase [Ruminococcus sp.]|nr:AAA family ATPase [Ruminococcus sp.]